MSKKNFLEFPGKVVADMPSSKKAKRLNPFFVDPDAAVSAFERDVLGIGSGPTAKPVKFIYKNIVLTPETSDRDKNLLNDLMNNSVKYNIIKWNDFWTRSGVYKVFIIYMELLEGEKDEQQ